MVLGGRHLIGIFALLVVILGVVFTLGYLLGRNQYDAQLNPSVEAASRRVEKSASKAEGKAGKTASAANQQEPADDTAPAPANWDFYHSGEESKTPAHLDAKPKPVTVKPARPAAATAEPKALVARANADATKTAPIPAKAAVVPSRNTANNPGTNAPTINATGNATANATGSASTAAAPLNTPPIPKGATVLQVAALVREADALALAQALQQKRFPAFVLTPGADHFYRVQVGPYADSQSANAARNQLQNQGFKSIIKR